MLHSSIPNPLNAAASGLPTPPQTLSLDPQATPVSLTVPMPVTGALPSGSPVPSVPSVPSAHTSSASSSGGVLPSSVRGAPPALRRLIRKRQNSESAKRCRQRKKLEDARAADELANQGARLHRLESLVSWLCATQEATQTALAALCQRAGVCARCAGSGCVGCTNSPLSGASAATPDADASALAAKVDEIAGWN